MDNDFRDRFRRATPEPPKPRPLSARPPVPRPLTPPQAHTQPIPKTPLEPALRPAATPQEFRRPKPQPPVQSAMYIPPPPEPETIIPRNYDTPKQAKTGRGKKVMLFALPIALLVILGTGGFWWSQRDRSDTVDNNTQQTLGAESPELKPQGTIRLIATGDNFTFDSVNNTAKKPDGSYDYLPMFADMKPFFDKADINVCHESVPTGGTVTGISGFPNFNAPPAFAKGLGDLGCNVIGMATAHMNDKGQAAIDATVAYWDNQPDLLAAAGANRSAEEQAKIRYLTIKSVKFAFLAYTTTTNNAQITPHGVNMFSDALAQQQISEARKNADFVIVSMNWGTENSGDIDTNQERIAQVLADLNADLVIGVGPHVLQPVKVLTSQDQQHQTLVWFSLGNFLNSQVPIEHLIGGIAVVNIDIQTQNIVDPKFLPVYMHYEWTADQKRREDLLSRQGLKLVPLDQATDLIPKSQNNTSVQAQTDRVRSIMTRFVPIQVITAAEY